MGKSRFTASRILVILAEGEAGVPIAEICRKRGISDPAYCQRKSKYVGMSVNELNASRKSKLRTVAGSGCMSAWLIVHKPVPPQPPKLNDAIRLIAGFGGFLSRKGDSETGAKSLWQGPQRVMDVAMGIRPAREAENCV